MTYVDLYLRAGNAGALASACPFLRYEDENGDRHWLTEGDGFSLDVIGAIALEPGTYDDETGEEMTPPVMAPGFHANLRCTEEVAALVAESMVIHPKNPVRGWA